MNNAEFVYTTYIKTTPEKVWAAITNPEFARQYWETELHSDWKKGSKWQSKSGKKEGGCNIGGEILESAPPKRLVISWVDPSDMDTSRVTFEIESIENMVRLNVVHDKLTAGSEMAKGISMGWPRVLSSMKSLLETGKALDTWAGHASTCSSTDAKGAAA